MRLWQTNPLAAVQLERGQGCTVWDTAGKPYLDLLAGTWCNVLGYNHPRLVRAVQEQAARQIHVGALFSTPEIEQGLAKLREILPPQLNCAVFLSTGSEAVELALKMARAATGKAGIAVIEQSFYGATSYTYALSEIGRGATFVPSFGDTYRLPAPICRNCPDVSANCDFACLDEAITGEIAAIMYEPVISAAGITVPPAGYGAQLRQLADQHAALLISEEVTTGMGRTGRWFGFEHDGIVPDILVIGKAIGAGLPVAVVVTTEAVEARCQGRLRHVQSHQNDPFSGQMAATVISIMQDEGLVQAGAEQGAYLLVGLAGLPGVLEVRGRGAMIGIQLEPGYAERGEFFFQQLLAAGYIVNFQPHTSSFRLFPPYVISRAEIDRFLAAFRQVLAEETPVIFAG